MSISLYEMTNDMRALTNLVESGDVLTAEMIADTMEGMKIEFDKKINSVLVVRQNYIREAEKFDAEAERLDLLAVAAHKKAEKLKQYVHDSMEGAKVDKVDCDLFKVSLRKATKKLGRVDESKIAGKFWIHVPETEKLDRRELLKAAKEAPIDGVEIIDSARSLTIK
mgnify:CR=1 FL=1